MDTLGLVVLDVEVSARHALRWHKPDPRQSQGKTSFKSLILVFSAMARAHAVA